MTSTNKPLDFKGELEKKPLTQAELVQQLLYQIVRVKELVKFYDSVPNGALGSSILSELIDEAQGSLINYDMPLMEKYYDLLLNCD